MNDSTKELADKPAASIEVLGIPITWNPGFKGFKFLGVPSILFWTNPSLVSMLQPLREEIGEELYACLIAFESSKGTYEDYHAMVSTLGKTFEEGFHRWGDAVGACGWGSFKVLSINWESKRAEIQIDDPWEMRLFESVDPKNNIPFLMGKVCGIFSHAFGTNCRSESVRITKAANGARSIILDIRPSTKTLEATLMELHSEQKGSEGSRLKAVNNALRRNERRLLDVIDTVGDFIWETDRNLNLTYVTDKANQIMNRSDNLIGLSWQNLLSGEEFERLKSLLADFSEEQRFVEAEFNVGSGSDGNSWIHLRIKQLLDFSGNHFGYVGSGRNVTGEVELRKILREKEAAEEANRAKSAFLANISHELRTPMHGILSFARFGQQKIDTATKEKLKSYFDEISESGTRLMSLLNDLLDLSKLEAGKVEYSMKADDFLVVAKAAISESEAFVEEKGLSVELQCNANEAVAVFDQSKMLQVIRNILLNAIKFSEKGSTIKCVAEVLDAKVRCSVINQGVGIPHDELEAIFNKFTQSSKTRTGAGGTGLGLAICKEIVKQHRGEIWAESEPNGETKFIFELPRR